MSDESGTYDPAENGETLTMEDVSLMPDWMGFSVLWAGALFLTCVALLFIPMVLFWILPWKLAAVALLATIAFDIALAITAFVASILTPSHESTVKYLRSRWAEFRGREPIRSDTALPSRRDR